MTSKFKVGDKVEVVGNEHGGWAVGTVGKITGITKGFPPINVEKDGDVWWHTEDELELFSPKPTKNQRIKALEETVAEQGKEINELKLIVAQIRKPSTVVQESLTAASSVEDISPVEKSPNEKRAEMIEKAKKFIDEQKVARVGHWVYIAPTQFGEWCDVEFIVNESKRTVVALLHYRSGGVVARGIAKCNPSDVFNEHIGKAIALGRALWLDVSEFEQAVQPTDFIKGQLVKYANSELLEVDHVRKNEVSKKAVYFAGGTWMRAYELTIINDTNAIYGSVEK